MTDKKLLTPTEVQMLKSCPHKHWLKHNQGLVPKEKKEYFSLGGKAHEMLAAYYNGYHPKGDILHGLSPKARGTLDGWYSTYPYVDPVKKLGHKVLKVEWVVPNQPIKNPTSNYQSRYYRLSGKVDLLTEDQDGRVWIWDHKTSSRSLDQYLDHLVFDFQMVAYMYLLNLAGLKPYGLVYNLLRKPSLRQRKKETEAEYEQRISEDIMERADKFPYFDYREVIYSQKDLDRCQKELWDLSQNLAHNGNKHWRNESACRILSCPYKEICINDSQVVRDNLFEKRERHPELNTEEV